MAPPTDEALAARAAAYAAASKAANTRRAYDSAWSDFDAWCSRRAVSALPAAGEDLALYLTELADAGRSVSTLNVRYAAIRERHKTTDQPKPGGAQLHRVWSGIRHTNGRPPRQKRAILTADLRRIVATLPATLSGLRDRALILVAFSSALRREELASLLLDDGSGGAGRKVQLTPLGLSITLDRSKADQEGRGARIGVPYGKTELCPVRALEAWLQAAGIVSGPIFRRVGPGRRIGPRAIAGKTVASIFKAACAAAGIDPAAIGGHSTRAGMITQAILNDVPVPVIMKTSRHRRVDTVNGYVRLADQFTDSAAGELGL